MSTFQISNKTKQRRKLFRITYSSKRNFKHSSLNHSNNNDNHNYLEQYYSYNNTKNDQNYQTKSMNKSIIFKNQFKRNSQSKNINFQYETVPISKIIYTPKTRNSENSIKQYFQKEIKQMNKLCSLMNPLSRLKNSMKTQIELNKGHYSSSRGTEYKKRCKCRVSQHIFDQQKQMQKNQKNNSFWNSVNESFIVPIKQNQNQQSQQLTTIMQILAQQ